MSRTGLVYDELLTRHCCPWDPTHPESPERYTECIDTIRNHGLVERCTVLEPRDATKEELRLLHTVNQIEELEKTKLSPEAEKLKEFCSRFDAVFANENTYDVAVRAAGCAIELTDQIIKGKLDNGLAVVRPPGHNASSGEFSKFCFFNNVALAARYAVNVLRVPRVLIVDWDIHHGQGTQNTFYNDPRVLCFSIHRYEHGTFWPQLRISDFDQIGRDTAAGFNINVPLNRLGLENWDYLTIFHQLLLPIAAEYRPKLILVSCGFGAALGDPEGGMRLTPAMYAHMTRMLQVFAPMSVILEGGYCLPAVAEGAALVLRTLLSDPCPRMLNIKRDSRSTDATVVESIGSVITVLKRYWKCLGHNKALEDVRSRIRYLGRRAAGNGICNLYEKPDAGSDATLIQMLKDLNRETRLLTASSPVKAVGEGTIEQYSDLKEHRFVTVDSLPTAQNLVQGSSLLINFLESGAAAFEESGSTIIINAPKLRLENEYDAVISMFSLVLPVYYKVYPDCVILNGAPAETDVALRALFSLCCAYLSCEGGLILVGSEPRDAELPTGDFAHDEKLAANNIREAARTFELEIDQFVERVVRPPTPSKFDDAKSAVARSCRGCYNYLKPETEATRRWCCFCSVLGAIIFSLLIAMFVGFPLVFCGSSDFRRWLILRSPSDDDFDFASPEILGLHCPMSYSIGYGNSVHLGLWYIPPRGGPCAEEIKDCCKKGPVFIYFHGLPGHRGQFLDIPKFLAEKINAHVFTFDYQGSGESSDNLPSRETILQDCIAILDTVLDVVPLERIFFWGHSFGAPIAVELAANISAPFGGLILEAPLSEVARRIELGNELNGLILPFLRSCVIDSAKQDLNINYNSTSALERVSLEVPVLILHAEDDEKVPFVLGKDLYEAWFRYRVEKQGAFVSMLAFEKQFGFGHDNIHKYERLQDAIRQFLFRVPLGQ